MTVARLPLALAIVVHAWSRTAESAPLLSRETRSLRLSANRVPTALQRAQQAIQGIDASRLRQGSEDTRIDARSAIDLGLGLGQNRSVTVRAAGSDVAANLHTVNFDPKLQSAVFPN